MWVTRAKTDATPRVAIGKLEMATIEEYQAIDNKGMCKEVDYHGKKMWVMYRA